MFHAVGHGTLFSGLISNRSNTNFSWMYDCGSKRTKRLTETIDILNKWTHWPPEIDLLVLSHFDDDHVNGVEELLSTRKVRWLALPYLDVAQKLAQAAAVSGNSTSLSTAMFQLNPEGWLASRGLSDRVSSILLVQGGDRPEDIGDIRFLPELLQPTDKNNKHNAREQELLQMQEIKLGLQKKHQTLVWNHHQPMIVKDLSFELMFFNSRQSNLFKTNAAGQKTAKRSGVLLSVVQADISSIVSNYRMNNLSTPRREWRDALKKCYERHFGSSSQDRNNISLCLLTRPIAEKYVCPCSIYCRELEPMTARCACSSALRRRPGLLCLGDLRIDVDTRSEISTHFGSRWSQIGVVQVPHHGSQHSWEKGNAKALNPECFIHCIPSESKNHPHSSVVADLANHKVYIADYEKSIQFPYCFLPSRLTAI
jgi:hypothetical protein